MTLFAVKECKLIINRGQLDAKEFVSQTCFIVTKIVPFQHPLLEAKFPPGRFCFRREIFLRFQRMSRYRVGVATTDERRLNCPEQKLG